MAERKVEERIDKGIFAVPTVLLCSETTAEHCHRRLVCEYLEERVGEVSMSFIFRWFRPGRHKHKPIQHEAIDDHIDGPRVRSRRIVLVSS